MIRIPADPRLIGVRDFNRDDIRAQMTFLYRSPPGFIESIGIDPKKLPPEDELRKQYEESFNSIDPERIDRRFVTITYEDKAIGTHNINGLKAGESGIFHSRLWLDEWRGRGICRHTYVRAARMYFNRFKLQTIIYKTPLQNTAAIRLKESLGIRRIGEELVSGGVNIDNMRVAVFELTRKELEKLKP